MDRKYRTSTAGGPGGGAFDSTVDSGQSDEQWVSKLEFAYSEQAGIMCGIRVTLNNGWSAAYGNMGGSPPFAPLRDPTQLPTVDLEQGDTLENLTLYGSSAYGGRFCGLEWTRKTTDSRRIPFSVGKTDGTPVQVSEGRLIGIFGRRGFEIDRLGLVMLDKQKSATMKNLSYTRDKGYEPADQQPVAATSATLKAWNESQLSTTLRASQEVSSSFSNTAEVDDSVELSVEGGFLDFEKTGLKVTTSWNVATSSSTGVTYQKDFSLEVSTDVEVGMQVTTTMWLTRGTISVHYSGDLVIEYVSGYVETIPKEGTYTGVTYFDAVSEVSPATPIAS